MDSKEIKRNREKSRSLVNGKRYIDRSCDMLVHGQLFVDELEGFEGEKHLFSHGIKHNAKKVIDLFRKRVDQIFNNTDNPSAIAKLYDINYELLSKLNKLSIDQKQYLSENYEQIVLGGLSMHVLEANKKTRIIEKTSGNDEGRNDN
jgi:macrodomain Ter protein organizer (MatP/YcbG family)